MSGPALPPSRQTRRRITTGPALIGLCAMAGAGCTTGETSQTSSSAAPSSVQELARAVQSDVATVWPRTGRIWPSVDFSGHSVLVTDGSTTYAVDKNEMRKVPAKDLEQAEVEVPRPDAFDVVTWQGKPSLILRPPQDLGAEQKPDPTGLTAPQPTAYTFGLASHEEFHPYVQQRPKAPWTSLQKLQESAADRTELYPLQAQPRVARAMVYNSLLTALQKPDQRGEHLSRAAYWSDTWAEDYPEDAKGQEATDLLEGTAKYFELSAIAMAAVKNPDDAAQIRSYIAETLKPMKVASKGIEPYAIGAVALLNADAQGRDLKKALTTQPTTPLAALLKGVTRSGAQRAPKDVSEGIRKGVATTNKELSASIDPFVADVQDKTKTVLMLPVESISGSFGGKGFYTTKELPISITPEARATFKAKTGTVKVNGATVAEIDEGGKGYFTLPLNPSDKGVRIEDDRLTLTGDHLTGTVTVKTTSNDGQRFLYVQ